MVLILIAGLIFLAGAFSNLFGSGDITEAIAGFILAFVSNSSIFYKSYLGKKFKGTFSMDCQ